MRSAHEEYKRHPSYGQIVLSRVQGTSRRLFGSNTTHNHTVRIEINEASMSGEHFGHSFLSGAGGRQLLVIEMTESQWASFICSQGMGSGTPCTLQRRPNPETGVYESVEPPPAELTARESFQGIVNDAEHEIRRRVEEAVAEIKRLTHGKVGKRAQEEIDHALDVLQSTTKTTVTYGVKSLHEVAEKITSRAKNEIEALVNNALRNAGMKAILEKALPASPFAEKVLDGEVADVKKLNP